ncbi:hypothetical protein BR93DRAFT_954145 [Coniochaeta sp. PMI_546]|nr:hypothetical protein BR93DRAFT_954145 [Coniochaeta sp. PMI_546]
MGQSRSKPTLGNATVTMSTRSRQPQNLMSTANAISSHPCQKPVFPLDGIDLKTVSNEQLAKLYDTAPVLSYQGAKIVRISETLVLKGGGNVAPTEAQNVKFAARQTHIRIPEVHRVFQCSLPEEPMQDSCLIVMDYIPGRSLDQCWSFLDDATRHDVALQTSTMIDSLQSMSLNHMPPGPIGGTPDAPFRGCWFSDYGAGPFATLQDLEDWCNHKIDVCLRFNQAAPNTPRFAFRDVVLTHQDIAPRNLILDPTNQLWLIDWAHAGIYPKGFEHAALVKQSRNQEFSNMVLSHVASSHDTEIKQLLSIQYGLTTAALL